MKLNRIYNAQMRALKKVLQSTPEWALTTAGVIMALWAMALTLV